MQNVKLKLSDNYKFYCVNCGSDDSLEEHEKFLDQVYNSESYKINDEFVVDDEHRCEKCGCNLYKLICNVEVEFN